MPHAEVKGAGRLRAFHDRFDPRALEWSGTVLKTLASYLSSDERSLLLDCLTVEGHLRQSFFALLTERDDGIMVRLLPRTSPEKTDGVKLLVAWLAWGIRSATPEASFGTTNLAPLLAVPLPPGAPLRPTPTSRGST